MDNYHHFAANRGMSSKLKNTEYSNKNNPTQNVGMASKGVAMSFGFKRRPTTAPASVTDNGVTSRNLTRNELIDTNGNGTARTTAKVMQPRQESTEIKKTIRYGYRPPNVNKMGRTYEPIHFEQKNNNRPKIKSAPTQSRLPSTATTFDTNENKTTNYYPTTQVNKYTFQSTQLPKPQLPTKLQDLKDTKTMMNNNRKISRKIQSNFENYNQKPDRSTCNEPLQTSTPFARNQNARNADLEMHNLNTFDLVESDELIAPIPSLPSAFPNNRTRGFGREMKYEPKINLNNRKPINEVVEKPQELNATKKSFLKTSKKEQSPEEYEWMQAGDAMADDFSFSFSSSQQSKEIIPPVNKPIMKPETLMLSSLTLTKSSMTTHSAISPIRSSRKILLNIDDPKFAAVAAASNTGTLLEDEPSPVDSITISYSECEDKHIFNNDLKKKPIATSSSDSKDVNEKLTKSSSSPGTPTNASNSLSLSDGKDYFDDEIEDQPALVFDDTTTEPISAPHHNSENTPTIINTTPKPRRKPSPLENSPLLVRKKNIMGSSTTSMDTLSPCESITSDDLMFDFEQSQASGIDDADRVERENHSIRSLENSTPRIQDNKINDFLRECSQLFAANSASMRTPVRANHSSFLLRSRASTPDSISSLNNRVNSLTNPLTLRSPRRLSRPTIHDNLVMGYESDDSINLDKTNHTALVQDVVQMKSMLMKLKRILNESENIVPFERTSQSCSEMDSSSLSRRNSQLELAELKRQILFLQDQLEDREQMVLELQRKMECNESAKVTPNVVTPAEIPKSNAATQTERVRPLSSSASLIQMSPTDSTMGSLVSFRIGKVVLADLLLGVCVLCAVNLLCLINLLYSCTKCQVPLNEYFE